MIEFYYKGVSSSGKELSGIIKASTKLSARDELTQQNITPIEIHQIKSSLWATLNKPINRNEQLPSKILSQITDELSSLIDAKLTLTAALQTLISINTNSSNQVLKRVLHSIKEGYSLADSLEKEPSFPSFYVSMIKAGEVSGTLPVVLKRLAVLLSEKEGLTEKVKSALIYPCILLFMVLLTIIIVAWVIIPQFEPIFAQTQTQLPFITSIVLAGSKLLTSHWEKILVFIAISFITSKILLSKTKTATALDNLYLKIPLLRETIRKYQIARFHKMLGTLVEHGVVLPKAFKTAQGTITNVQINGELTNILTKVRQGQQLSTLYKNSIYIPSIASKLVAIGENSGHMANMLHKSADIMEKDVNNTVNRILSLLVPILTIIMGLIVALLISSILIGIISVNELAF